MNVTQLPCYIYDYSILIEKNWLLTPIELNLMLFIRVRLKTLFQTDPNYFDTIVKYEKHLYDIFANWQLFSSRCFS